MSNKTINLIFERRKRNIYILSERLMMDCKLQKHCP
jgi:hypothetical protein